jgi:phosphatidylcholine synthase
MVVFTLFVIEPGQWVSFAAVVVAGILTFVPMNFLHPVRVVRLRSINLPMTLVWCAFGTVALLQSMHASHWVKIGIAVSGIYLFFIGGLMQLFPSLGARPDLEREKD